jgi:hypothetical protein
MSKHTIGSCSECRKEIPPGEKYVAYTRSVERYKVGRLTRLLTISPVDTNLERVTHLACDNGSRS